MLTVFNDIHIGAKRSGGTTPDSQLRLRKWILDQFGVLLENTTSSCMILGDLFDTAAVDSFDFYETYTLFLTWLRRHNFPQLWFVAGNHDLAKTSTNFSSFKLLGQLLKLEWPLAVHVVTEPEMTPYGYVIPHLANQDLFDAALAEAPACSTIFLHCNYDNKFAVESDQSLNLSPEQAEALKCETILIGHEHRPRTHGKVHLPGNQIPSSISDLLYAPHKQYSFVSEKGNVEFRKCFEIADLLSEHDWREEYVDSGKKFVRLVGAAEPEEVSQVIAATHKARKVSGAFIVGNGVKSPKATLTDEFAETLKSVKTFDVMEALKQILTAEEFAVIESVKDLP